VSVEARRGYILSKRDKTMRLGMIDDFGNEIRGSSILILDEGEVPLVNFNVRKFHEHPIKGNLLNEESGDLIGIETDQGIDLFTGYDINKPAKYPKRRFSPN